MLAAAWWSLKLRWFASHATPAGRIKPTIRLFVLFHDPALLQTLPDSHGMQKGLVGVVHVFSDRKLAGSNHVVIAHELLHTLGATDKYVLGTGEPFSRSDLRTPRPTPAIRRLEIMAGRRPLSRTQSEIPVSLRETVVGPATALKSAGPSIERESSNEGDRRTICRAPHRAGRRANTSPRSVDRDQPRRVRGDPRAQRIRQDAHASHTCGIARSSRRHGAHRWRPFRRR